MSQLQTDINLPPINSIDGFVTDGSMTTVMYSVENELDSIGNAIGNIYGTGDFQYDERKLINSVASTVGTELQDPALPYGKQISSIVETHTLSGAKESVLGLVLDTESAVTIEGFNNLNVSLGNYTLATDPYNMTDTECFVDGRLILFKKPPYSFTVSYTGQYPTSPFLDKEGYLPNVIPNPKSASFERPSLSLSSGRVVVTINRANAIKTTNTYDDQYEIVFSDYLLQFVDGSGITPCPKAYISAYKLNTLSGVYDKLNVNNIYIINNSRFEIDTDEEIDLDNDVIIISIANMSIKDWIIVAIRELQNHKHDGSDISSPLNHSDLAGLVPSSTNPDINYGKSQLPNNDHPQYLNREGYKEDDNGTYRNAMLGDLFVASVNPDNLFNNIADRSNQIIFGATGGAGHSIYREPQAKEGGAEDVLAIASESNGIRISYEYNNNEKYAIGMQSNGDDHRFANKVDTNDLLVASNTGKTVFGHYDGGTEAYILDDINVDKAIVDSLDVGPVSIARQVNNVEVTSTNAGSSFNFSTTVGIKSNTISKGIKFTDGTNVFAKIYDCAADGTASTNVDNQLIIASQDSIYLSKNVTDITAGIASDDRATLYAGDTHFYTVGANKTAGTKKNGIQFGNDHSIYLTNTGESYASGIMVVEANNKVIFTKPTLSIDVSTPIYTDIEAGNIRANGEISGLVRSDQIIADVITVNGNLVTSVGSLSTFNGSVVFNSPINFNDDVTIGVLTVPNVANITQLLATNSTITNLIGAESTNLKGQVVFSEHITNPSSFTCNIASTFNGPVSFSNQVTATQLTVNGTLTSTGTFTATTLTVSNTLTVSGTADITNLNVTNDFSVDGKITAANIQATSDITVDGKLTVYGESVLGFGGNPTKIYDDVEMSSAGKTIDMNNGKITNLQMETYAYDFLAEPSPAIDPVRGKDAVNREFVINAILNIASQKLLSTMYPLHSIYMSTNNPSSPGSTSGPFGALAFGEWEKIPGRFLVGDGTWTDSRGDTRTLAANSSGGEYEHVLTKPEMPAHSHNGQYTTHDFKDGSALTGQGLFTDYGTGTNDFTTKEEGGDGAHNNMPPYLVVYMWRRTA